MPAKKTATVKTSARQKRPIGLTSALGPKGTTMVVIAVMAGGILVAARQQSTPKDVQPVTMSAEITPESKAAVKKTSASLASSASTAASPVATTATVSATAAPKAPPVTLTGCLVQADDTFRLKDAAGTGAPKARSWKSGFLKKGSASVEVVDTAHAWTLANHVGRRVSVTGTLVDREIQVRSLRRVAASCDDRPGV
jgi:uncharacterized protein YdeI (BOF family)